MSDYNGWHNYETWNVALWINNDEGLCGLASACRNYEELIEQLRGCGITETPDGVAFNDSGLDRGALDVAIEGLRGEEFLLKLKQLDNGIQNGIRQ